MNDDGMSRADVRFLGEKARVSQGATPFYKLSHLRKLRGSEQVAAVCFRLCANGIEFLLVQTRGGRWTFPKGGVEPGLTHAQAAAIEAFEEAGVHGRMEEAPFARYVRARGKADKKDKKKEHGRVRHREEASAEKSPGKGLVVHAHLCEVLSLTPPSESGRNPSWFSVEKAKRRLRHNRGQDHAGELIRVVDRAVTRIRRVACPNDAVEIMPPVPEALVPARDPLHRVQIEAGQTVKVIDGMPEFSQAFFSGYVRRRRGDLRHSALELAVNAYLSKVLGVTRTELSPQTVTSPAQAKRRLRAGSDADVQIKPVIAAAVAHEALQTANRTNRQSKVTQIDSRRRLIGKTRAARENG